MTHFVSHYGLWVVFGVVFLEVAGLPFIPGETALIAAGALASQGKGSIVWTITLAVLAAVLGAAFGYVVGRTKGKEILAVWPWFERVTAPGVHRSEEFFDRHGSKAVFLGRFVPIVRATIGWMAGMGRMSVLSFAVWNVAGALAWGCGIGLAAYYAGAAIVDTIQRDAFIGVGVIAALALLLLGVHVWRKRLESS